MDSILYDFFNREVIYMKTHFQSLYRSPLKTLVTLLLLAAAAFLFLYNLSEYSI